MGDAMDTIAAFVVEFASNKRIVDFCRKECLNDDAMMRTAMNNMLAKNLSSSKIMRTVDVATILSSKYVYAYLAHKDPYSDTLMRKFHPKIVCAYENSSSFKEYIGKCVDHDYKTVRLASLYLCRRGEYEGLSLELHDRDVSFLKGELKLLQKAATGAARKVPGSSRSRKVDSSMQAALERNFFINYTPMALAIEELAQLNGVDYRNIMSYSLSKHEKMAMHHVASKLASADKEYMCAAKDEYNEKFDIIREDRDLFVMYVMYSLYVISKLISMNNECKEIAIGIDDENTALIGKLAKVNKVVDSKIAESKKSLSSILKENTDTINRLQIENDKLRLELEEERAKNEMINEFISDMNAAMERGNGEDSDSDDAFSCPSGTVMWGGHPRWQKFWLQRHPDTVTIVGEDTSIDNNVFINAPMVIINTTNMSHRSFYKYMPVIKANKTPYVFWNTSIK